MALTAVSLEVLGKTLGNPGQAGCGSRIVASLGYPDLLASEAQLRRLFGAAVADRLSFRSDSAEIIAWHKAGDITDRVATAESLFGALGFELEVIDIVAARGGEIIVDLNVPVPDRLQSRYAVVLDAGTLEHCFNIAQGVRNVAGMTAAGGAVIHSNPLNMYNHGFYNLNPTWYHDFYEENGFVIELLHLVQDAARAPRVADVPAFKRFFDIPENCTLVVVARRERLQDLRWPIQRKYRNNPGLRG